MTLTSLRILFLTFAVCGTHGYDNLALNKPTWQSQQYDPRNSKYQSSNAVDGLKSNLSGPGGQCAVSANCFTTATWWVNLTTVHSIHDIKIYYRTDYEVWDRSKYARRFLGFYTYVSNTTNRLDGHLCFHDTQSTKHSIPAVANITCPVHGQYVIYYNERLSGVTYPNDYSNNAHHDLCEVEVYGCESGYYGINCSLSCPENCRYCNIETGVCSWCKTGYQGYQCENVCDGGRYGQDCGQKCGACLGYKQCHNINGSCLEGCDAGYEGAFCTNECSAGKFGYNCERDCNENCGIPNRCNGMTGVCQGGCQIGFEGPRCRKIPKREQDWQTRFYGTLGGFAVSVTANAIFVAYVCLKWRRKKSLQKTMKESSNPMQNISTDIYDDSNQNVHGGYLEVGERDKPSHYDVI